MDLALWRQLTQRPWDCLALGVTLGLLVHQAAQEMPDILVHPEHQEFQEVLVLLDLHLMFPATTTNWLSHKLQGIKDPQDLVDSLQIHSSSCRLKWDL